MCPRFGSLLEAGHNHAMDENSARQVLLVRAIESAESSSLISNDDRLHASRAAAELVRWQASDQKAAPSADQYMARRAEFLLQKAALREPSLLRALHAFQWRPWIGIALPALALLAGILIERVADRQHVNLLAFPLLLIVLWNLVVYALLIARRTAGWMPSRRAERDAPPVGLRRWLVALAERTLARPRTRPALSGALTSFAAAWARASAALIEARAARILHFSAALFGAGAVLGLYLRGLVFDYRAGWESTFLDATAVHALLSVVLAPAAWLLQMPLPELAEVEALRFGGAAAPASAARWIHLYAATVALFVIIPRLLLAAWAGLLEGHRQRHFKLDLAEPYYRRLLSAFSTGPVKMRVVPYSHRVDEAGAAGLAAIARVLLGDSAESLLRPTVEYGAEEQADEGLINDDAEVAVTVALFNLAATPENESHGVFLDRLCERVASRVVALIDESALLRRLGAQNGAERIDERRAAWLAFCSARGVTAATANLSSPDLQRVETELGRSLNR
jgi:hypothetical protein